MPAEARRRNAEETLDIYAPLAGRMGMHEMREELEDLSFREINPEAYEVVSARLNADRRAQPGADRGDRAAAHHASSPTAASPPRCRGGASSAYSVWRKMERKSVGFEQLSDIFGFRVIVQHARRLLPGARHRAHHLADGAGPLQGLRLHAQGQRLSLDPHHGDRAGPAARRAADPHHRDARDRRIRHRRARALQGQCRLADRAACRASRAPMPGCAAPSSSWRKARARRNSSSTPSSNCSTTRCSASRPRAS